MKINFKQSGGFTGLVTGCVVEIDTLPVIEQQEIQSYLDVCRSGTSEHNSQARDSIQYEITIENQDNTETFLFDDISMPSALQGFIKFLTSRSAPISP